MPDATTPQCGPVFIPRTILQDRSGKALLSPDLCLPQSESKPLFETDSPDSGHREMSSDNLALTLPQDLPFLTMTQDQQLKYSFGFGSPVKIQHTSYEMTAVVNSNPFADSKDNLCDAEFLEISGYEGSRHEDGCEADCNKDDVAPKLQPPPEFRNFASLRNSQFSEDSSNSSNSDTDSVKDGIVNFTDSDYYSHTGSSTLTNQTGAQFQDNRDMTHSGMLYRPKLEYHFNNFAADQTLMQKYFEQNRQHGSFSDEDNTESYDESLAQPPSPPPPPSRLEDVFDD